MRSSLPRWASAAARALFEQAGLRALYMGDEAIVDTSASASKDVRSESPAVGLAAAQGGVPDGSRELGSLDDQVVDAARADRERLARGAPERGFSMAMDSLRNPEGEERSSSTPSTIAM